MEKQIEEMAKILCFDYGGCDKCSISNPLCETPCTILDDCEALYNAGYRKQSEGKWIDKDGQSVKFNATDGCPEKSCYCSVCGEWLVGSDEYPCNGNFCPNCGAYMKGEKEE